MSNGKGASAPLFFVSCVPSLRGDALLNVALQALEAGDFASALIAAEYTCRRFPSKSIAAILRAQILQRCQPELAAKAWYFAWCCDPLDAFLQDAMLDAWSLSGADQSVRELTPLFLPSRCQSGQVHSLIEQLNRVKLNRFGACWKADDKIFGRIFAPLLPNGQHETVHLLLADECQQSVYPILADGQVFKLDCPQPNGAWSLAFVDAEHLSKPALLHGSPLSFSSVEQDSASPIEVVSVSPQDTFASNERHVCLLIPVYRGYHQVRACLESVLQSLAHNQARVTVLVIDDASPEQAISEWLAVLALEEKITLLRNTYNLGFIETVNRGLRYARNLNVDVMLLNADTLVHSNWVDRMLRALYSATDIASVTPWSNNGEISSFPAISNNNVAPNLQQLAGIDTQIATLRESGQISDVEVPACCGFAMLMKSEVIRQIGLLDGFHLTRGYSEEVDWCLRASAHGYRHLVATGVFIAHAGGVSFGTEKTFRVAQNRSVIASRYPHFYETYHRFIKQDPLLNARNLVRKALLQGGCTWLSRLLPNPKEAVATPALRVLPSALPGRYERIAVWENRMHSAFSHKILQLARRLATLVETQGGRFAHLRLLIIGEVSEALWHTGVVDVLPSIATQKSSLLSDPLMLGFSGCIEVLADHQTSITLSINKVLIDDNFDPIAYLDKWNKG
nr:glycosyltransferase [uncultured Undibacterium sp.]